MAYPRFEQLSGGTPRSTHSKKQPQKYTKKNEDNAAAIHLGHGLRGNNKQKHFAVRLRFLWEHIHCKNIEFAKVATGDQLADALTKQLPGPAFIKFRNQILKSNKGHRAT